MKSLPLLRSSRIVGNAVDTEVYGTDSEYRDHLGLWTTYQLQRGQEKGKAESEEYEPKSRASLSGLLLDLRLLGCRSRWLNRQDF